jgi:Ulp1 family protease
VAAKYRSWQKTAAEGTNYNLYTLFNIDMTTQKAACLAEGEELNDEVRMHSLT